MTWLKAIRIFVFYFVLRALSLFLDNTSVTFSSFLILLIPHTHSAAASAGGVSAGLGMYDRDEVDRGDDEGENWVDVDPQELLALGYSHSTGSAGPDAAGTKI